MLKKTITYIDYNGNERTETHYFNVSETEAMEMEMSVNGGLSESIKRIIETQNTPELIGIFKKLIHVSYGEKSADGRYFLKEDENGKLLVNKFKQTEAYNKLYMELATNAEAASNFVNGILPDIKKPEAIKNI